MSFICCISLLVFSLLCHEALKISPFSSQLSQILTRTGSGFIRYSQRRRLSMLLKPIVDDRQYRLLDLENGVRVLLIQDHQSLLSSCTLAVKVGAACDSLPGLAHMTEHAVFLGSAKYPIENEYKKFLNQNGGGSNGGTSMEYTNYKFFIKSSAFKQALDIFSQLFKGPTFSPEALTREVLAVDAEDSKNRILDGRRLLQVLKSLLDDTDYKKYSTGNVNTLAFGNATLYGDLLSQKVREFHETHYNPSQMTVCLAGPQDLSELEQLAFENFQNITGVSAVTPNGRSVQEKSDTGKHLTVKNQIIKIKPVKDIRDMQIIWEVSPTKDCFATTPCHLFEFVLDAKGEGSLFASLQDKGYITNLSAGLRTSFHDLALFEINLSLTVEGLRQIGHILHEIEAYLSIIRQSDHAEILEIWNDMKRLREVKFTFSGKSSLYETTPVVASNLLEFPAQLALAGDYLLEELDIDKYRNMLDKLLVQESMVIVRSKDFDLPDDDTEFLQRQMHAFETMFDVSQINSWKHDGSYFDQLLKVMRSNEALSKDLRKELFYGVSYSVESLSTVLDKTEVNREESKHMKLPGRNKYIPIDLLSNQERYALRRELNTNVGSSVICPDKMDSSMGDCWNSTTKLFQQQPKYVGYMLLPTQSTDDAHPMLSLIGSLFDQVSVRKYYDAIMAGVSFDFTLAQRGISLTFQGFEPKLPQLMEDVCTNVSQVNFWESITEEMFNNSKERQLRSLQSWYKERPDAQALSILSYILQENTYLQETKIRMCSQTSYEMLLERMKNVLTSLSRPLVYLHGNYQPEMVGSIVENSLRQFSTSTSSPEKGSIRSRLLPKPNNHIVRLEPFNPEDPNNACVMFFQAEANAPSVSARLLVLRRLLAEPAFNYLRTQKQLGYIVSLSPSSYGRGLHAVRGLELKVLSKTHSPQDILKEAQHFFEMQEKLIEVLTESDLSMVKEALIKNLRDPPNSISEEASEVWGYLVNDLPLDWTMQIIEQIEQLELAVVKNTAKNWIFDNNCRRMLTITIGRESSNRLDGDLEALPMNKIYNGIEGVKKLRNEIAFHDEKYLD